MNEDEIERVFNFVVKTKQKSWEIKTKLYRNKIMNFDYGNQTFKKILKNS